MKPSFNKIEETFFYAVSGAAALVACLFLFWILIEIFIRAIPSLTWYFISTPESETPKIGMGIANAIWGSVLISLIATFFAMPLALGTAIYLQKYAIESRMTKAFRFFIEVLSGTPSIVIGIFGLIVLVYYLRPFTGGFSLLAGSIALSILIMPVIERSIENAINAVPFELEEGSYALGATKWQTIRLITLPTAVSGMITGAILGFGRAAEESAVVILTAGYSQFMPEFTIKPNSNLLYGIKVYPIQDLVGTLPYSVYHAYENSNVIKVSNGFAAAVILIGIVILVNILAKIIITRAMPGRGNEGNSWTKTLKAKIFPQKNESVIVSPPDQSKKSPEDQIKSMTPSTDKSGTNSEGSQSLKNRIAGIFSGLKFPGSKKKPESATVPQDEPAKDTTPKKKNPARTFLRALLPFTIPAALLLLIAFLATIPPFHHALGPVSPSLSRLFAIGLYLIVMIVSVVFGILLAKKAGVFKGKSRRIGFAGVATGVCLLCIAGIICALAAPGIFSTGEQQLTKDKPDRIAQLASLMAEFEEADGGTSSAPVDNAALSSSSPNHASPGMNTSSGVIIPVKDALSLGESYHYGDATRTCSATVYDYTVLPFYFWWFIDYNRFVQQIPHTGNSYLVVFIRIEDTGTNSALVPSAEKIQISNNGKTYSHEPYFNTSVLSSYQIDYYSDHYEQLPYQWVREIGQDKRDYAFLTRYNIFGGWNFVSNPIVKETATVSTITSTGSSSSNNGKGFFIKPGPGNAIDGYLVFEVPDSVVKQDIDKTYVDISFNANSGTRWRLK
jgi:phosphate transport system permease protein